MQSLQFDQAKKADLGIALHHNVIDVSLQRHADVLPLLGVKLEDVQHAGHAHLEEDCLAAAAELHDVAQLCRVQVLLGHGPEEVHAALVDAQNQLGGQEPNGVFYSLHREEDRIACRKSRSRMQHWRCGHTMQVKLYIANVMHAGNAACGAESMSKQWPTAPGGTLDFSMEGHYHHDRTQCSCPSCLSSISMT